MKYTDIEITISRRYEVKFGTETEVVDTIDGKDLQEEAHFGDETWDITKDDFIERVKDFFTSAWFENNIEEKGDRL